MATGDAADNARRMRDAMPPAWFPLPAAIGAPTTTPVLDGVLAGLGAAWAFAYSLLSTVRAQMRLATSSGFFLDMAAVQYFGTALTRLAGEGDAAFAQRIKVSLLPLRATRQAVTQALTVLTGQAPLIIEPARPQDTGGMSSLASPGAGGNYGYGSPGLYYGSLLAPFQCFVTATGGSAVPAATVLATIHQNMPAGTIAWVNPAG